MAHAGQIYEFMANDAFRTGAEWTLAHRWRPKSFTGQVRCLGSGNCKPDSGCRSRRLPNLDWNGQEVMERSWNGAWGAGRSHQLC